MEDKCCACSDVDAVPVLVVRRELSVKAKLLIYQLINVPHLW